MIDSLYNQLLGEPGYSWTAGSGMSVTTHHGVIFSDMTKMGILFCYGDTQIQSTGSFNMSIWSLVTEPVLLVDFLIRYTEERCEECST